METEAAGSEVATTTTNRGATRAYACALPLQARFSMSEVQNAAEGNTFCNTAVAVASWGDRAAESAEGLGGKQTVHFCGALQ